MTLAETVVAIPDTTTDGRVAALPAVVARDGVRLYMGAPLIDADGRQFGALCVMDPRARAVVAEEVAALRRIAQVVSERLSCGSSAAAPGHGGSCWRPSRRGGARIGRWTALTRSGRRQPERRPAARSRSRPPITDASSGRP